MSKRVAQPGHEARSATQNARTHRPDHAGAERHEESENTEHGAGVSSSLTSPEKHRALMEDARHRQKKLAAGSVTGPVNN